MMKDGSTKHEAIEKAKSMIIGNPKIQKQLSLPGIKSQNVQVEFAKYQKALLTNKSAQKYLSDRKLNPKLIEVGYKGKSAKDKWGSNCVIFPLKDTAGNLTSLYGRAISNNVVMSLITKPTSMVGRHYYQAGRSGFYPEHPKSETKTLVLCESIIDTATLLQLKSDANIGFTFLAMYGTNGLTKEHLQAIEKLEHLEEIIFALDGDAAGQAATNVHAEVLVSMCPRIKITQVELPEGEDINSLAVSHDDWPELFSELFKNRTAVEIKIEKKAPTLPLKTSSTKLLTADPYHLLYQTNLAKYAIKGGIRNGAKDLDSLKITLVVENEKGLKSRNKLDLYEDKQVEKVSRIAGEKLDLRADGIEIDLQSLTDRLDEYRQILLDRPNPEAIEKVILSEAEKKAAITFLKQKDLLQKFNEQIGKSGITGEEKNRLLLFVVASSYKMPDTLHALIQGSSGSGKTRLLRVISELMPEEKVKRYTRVTDSSFYNQAEYYFKNKLLCFEDIDGLKEDALLAVRELQSNEILITSTSIKDEHGGISGGERIVRGPIASISCTTKAQVYEDNISRCFVVAVDESKAQSLRIIKYQNEKSAGLLNRAEEKATRQFIQNCLRLLQPLEVINPFANQVQLPEDAHKIRRLNELYQSFVRQVTLLNQYQRKRDKQGRVITQKEDLKSACEILFDSIVLKVDELDGSLRQFYEQLKVYVQERSNDYQFTQRELRQALRISRTQIQRYLTRLVELEYLQQYGHMNRGFKYKISYWDESGALAERIRKDLNVQLQG